jgi:hypothetical protein
MACWQNYGLRPPRTLDQRAVDPSPKRPRSPSPSPIRPNSRAYRQVQPIVGGRPYPNCAGVAFPMPPPCRMWRIAGCMGEHALDTTSRHERSQFVPTIFLGAMADTTRPSFPPWGSAPRLGEQPGCAQAGLARVARHANPAGLPWDRLLARSVGVVVHGRGICFNCRRTPPADPHRCTAWLHPACRRH